MGLEGSRVGIFGPANICPSALCQNMLEVHLDRCPRVSALSRSCACLHDNSRNCVNCCALSQMLLCTCGLIRWHFPPLHTKEFRNFLWFPCQKCVADMMGVGRSHVAKHQSSATVCVSCRFARMQNKFPLVASTGIEQNLWGKVVKEKICFFLSSH